MWCDGGVRTGCVYCRGAGCYREVIRRGFHVGRKGKGMREREGKEMEEKEKEAPCMTESKGMKRKGKGGKKERERRGEVLALC